MTSLEPLIGGDLSLQEIPDNGILSGIPPQVSVTDTLINNYVEDSQNTQRQMASTSRTNQKHDRYKRNYDMEKTETLEHKECYE